MQQVSTRPLTPRSKEQLLKLLQVGEFAPKEEHDRVINSRLSLKQQSVMVTEPTSEIRDASHSSLESAPTDQLLVSHDTQPQDSFTDEDEACCTANQVPTVTNSLLVRRQGSEASSNPASDDTETRTDHSVSAPLTPPLQVQIRPVSMSLTLQNMKRVISDSSTDADQLSSKEGDRDSTDSIPIPECRYSDQIKQCIASIEDIVDSSRKLEVHIREKHTANRPMEAGPL